MIRGGLDMSIDLYKIIKQGVIKQTNRCEDDVCKVLDDEVYELIEELEEKVEDKLSKIDLDDKDFRRMFDCY